MSFRINLKMYREQKGLSQADLAKMLGISQSTVGMWENGKNRPRVQVLEKLTEIFGVTTNDLIGTPSRSGAVKIPVLGKVAAGIPIEAVEDILDYEEITPEMANGGEYFALRISGNSMEPRMRDGDVVIVRKQEDVDSGSVAIVLVNGDDATCKKFVRHDNGVSLISLNPAYPPMFYTNEEIENKPVRILGRVVELRAKF